VIENELRDLLTIRAASVPDNPTRLAEVRSRVRTIRRRRSVGAVLALVLLAIGGVVLTRLPGRPDALPPADRNVPAPPYFRGSGLPAVPGYVYTARREVSGPTDDLLIGYDGARQQRLLVLVRCPQAGSLVVRNVLGPSLTVPCRGRVGDHFEGAASLEPGKVKELFAQDRAEPNVRYEPSGPGDWVFGLVAAPAPDRLSPVPAGSERPLVDGADHPDGTASLQFTVPAPRPGSDPGVGFGLTFDCALDVRLVLTVPGGELASFVCDAAHGATGGGVGGVITKAQMAQLGLRVGDRSLLTIRSVGAHRDQWRLYPIT
jgi:hypothetical protein